MGDGIKEIRTGGAGNGREWDTFLCAPVLGGGGEDLGDGGLLLLSQAQPAALVKVLLVTSDRNQFEVV